MLIMLESDVRNVFREWIEFEFENERVSDVCEWLPKARSLFTCKQSNPGPTIPGRGTEPIKNDHVYLCLYACHFPIRKVVKAYNVVEASCSSYMV